MPRRRALLMAAAACAGTLGPIPAWSRRRSQESPLLDNSPPEPATVVYPRHLPQQDNQVNYFIELLSLALARSGTRYTATPTRSEMVQSRALLEMHSGQPSIDVFWTMTHPERERSLIPIRVPLDRGLIGWRLCLIRGAQPGLLRQVRDLTGLARFTAGQMHDWPDTDVLRANGLQVRISTHYQGLFEMLSRGRFDYFPRALFEIDAELAAFSGTSGSGLAIDPTLLIHYPAALYLFVRPGRPRLAADLTYGMESLVADGTFERLSQQQFGGLLRRHNIDKRRVLRLHNPLLPPDTPLNRRPLWWPLPGR